MRPRKSLGQCFLNAPAILDKEAALAELDGKSVLEIGAGDGRLTKAVLEAGAKRIIAVEKDPKYAKKLHERFAGERRMEVVEGDFLEMDPIAIDRIIGNIPYYISSAIVFRLKDWQWERAVLMVQKEFAQKMVAKPNEKNYGRLSVTAQLAFDVTYVQTVPSRFFTPQPKVASAIIVLRPLPRKLSMHEEGIIRILFQHKNQTVRNALKHGQIKTEGLEEWLGRRVRTLAPAECRQLAGMVRQAHLEASVGTPIG